MDLSTPPIYVTSLEEIIWGGTLMAVTMVIHAFGMLSVLRIQDAMKRPAAIRPTFVHGMLRLIVASWLILLVHLVEVAVWALFFLWKGAVNAPNANASLSYYFSLNEYTTLGSDYNLILRWRLLEGMISMAGLLTFAWSTGVLLTQAQDFQEQRQQLLKARSKRQPKPAPALAAHDARTHDQQPPITETP